MKIQTLQRENWPAKVENIEVKKEDIEVREEEEDIENKESQNLSCSKASDWTLNSSGWRWRFVTFVAMAWWCIEILNICKEK